MTDREFVDEDLTVARFVRCDLSGAVLRAVDVQGVEIDAPWLMEEGGVLLVNGVDVAPLVDAELERLAAMDGMDTSVFSTEQPSYDEVLTVRAGHVAHMRDVIAAVTPELLAEERRRPWDPAHPETVLACLHVILNEEWEHHRFAGRDLDAIEATAATT